MQTIEYTVKKLVLTPEEKIIKKAWGDKWNIIKRDYDKHGFFYLITGEWSGYTSNQRKTVHIDTCNFNLGEKYKHDNGYIGTIKYSDNTTLTVYAEKFYLKTFFNIQMCQKPRPSYTDLIKKLIDSGETIYTV